MCVFKAYTPAVDSTYFCIYLVFYPWNLSDCITPLKRIKAVTVCAHTDTHSHIHIHTNTSPCHCITTHAQARATPFHPHHTTLPSSCTMSSRPLQALKRRSHTTWCCFFKAVSLKVAGSKRKGIKMIESCSKSYTANSFRILYINECAT